MSAAEKEASQSLAKYAAHAPDTVAKCVGFDPHQFGFAALFDEISVNERMNVIISLAERVEHGSGNLALALMSQRLSEEYPSIRHEPSLKKLLEIAVKPEDITFELPQLLTNQRPLQWPELERFKPLFKYMEGSATGEVNSFQRYFGTTREVALNHIVEEGDFRTAFGRKLQSLPEESRRLLVNTIIDEVAESYPAIRMEVAQSNLDNSLELLFARKESLANKGILPAQPQISSSTFHSPMMPPELRPSLKFRPPMKPPVTVLKPPVTVPKTNWMKIFKSIPK